MPKSCARVNMSHNVYSSRHCNACLGLRAKTPNSHHTLPSPGEQLYKCEQCHLVRYCSRQHQKMDWPYHRDLCRAIKRIKSHMQISYVFDISGEIKNVDDLYRAIVQIKFLVRCFINRELNAYESELINFPELCAVCYERRQLQTCAQCNVVSYCSTAHREADATAHSKQCQLLQRCYAMYDATQLHFDYTLHDTVVCRDSNLTDAFELLTHTKLPSDPLSSESAFNGYIAAADFSCIGTIAYAMKLLEQQGTQEFTICIVGATVERQLWFESQHIKFFFMHFPTVERLNLHFIGPELSRCLEHDAIVQTCDLEGVKHTSTSYCHHIHFQEFVLYNPDIQPSIIVVYNCGFGEKEFSSRLMCKNYQEQTAADINSFRWKRGLESMLHFDNMPIVFTSYTKSEAKADLSVIELAANNCKTKKHLQRICEIMANPYKDLRPLRNCELTDVEDFYYRNNYLQVVRPQLTA